TEASADTTASTSPPPPTPGNVTVLDGPAAPVTITSSVAGSPVSVTNAVVNTNTNALAITVDGQTTYRTPTSVSSLDVKADSLIVDVNQGAIAAPVTYEGPSIALASSSTASDWTINGDGTGTVSGGGISSISFKSTTTISAGGPNDTLHGPAADTSWTIDGVDGGTVAGTAFRGFENLSGASDNKDEFHLAPGGAVSGVVD